MSKHTPGPWRRNKGGYVYAADCVVAKVGDFADRELLPFNRERWLADSDLIAAAPEMLEALKNIENDDGHMPSSAWRLIQDAIAKAEGRT